MHAAVLAARDKSLVVQRANRVGTTRVLGEDQMTIQRGLPETRRFVERGRDRAAFGENVHVGESFRVSEIRVEAGTVGEIPELDHAIGAGSKNLGGFVVDVVGGGF